MLKNDSSYVILIGGPPGAGKTTLGTAVAQRLAITSLSIDDLVTAVQAVTTPTTHPGLHLMWQTSSAEYFTYSSIAQLTADATKQHQACWPFIKKVIRKHALGGRPIVIDGWQIRPKTVVALGLENVYSGWIVPDPAVLERRERNNFAWFQESPEPERMLANFLTRSLWHNETIREQALQTKSLILSQAGDSSVDELCDIFLANYNFS